MIPLVSKITVYPLKSFDGVDLEFSDILTSGSLKHDRQLALLDTNGKYFNAKNYPDIHQYESQFHKDWYSMVITRPADSAMEFFDLRSDHQRLVDWIRNFHPNVTSYEENILTGLPDDREANGPTIISEATLELVASWFEGLSIHNIRQRLRPNIEISGVPAFWEDRLFDNNIPFSIGTVRFIGTHPCQRCVVPTRCPQTGVVTPRFADIVAQNRKKSLPEWSHPGSFNHYYRLATNTKLAEDCAGGNISLGDEIILPANLSHQQIVT
ncbi:MAG: MOSC domain-containing protein [Planctomycetaceae bacterium]|nr:MOSC domain-containing protein [Planctomycetaceae bacterium]|tara:strand:+ start:218 stop:1021 length:804 start_codon:yes stop_codon:yes gene_type:complete